MAGLFKLVLKARDLQSKVDEIINIFGYKSFLSVSNELFELATRFESDVLPDIVPILHARYEAYEIDVYEVGGTNNFLYYPMATPQDGAQTGDSNPGFMAWLFRYERALTGQRHGYKRFSIVAENDISDGEAAAGAATRLATCAATLETAISVGLIQTWFPVILSKPAVSSDPWTSHDIAGVTYQRVSTQNSRKK